LQHEYLRRKVEKECNPKFDGISHKASPCNFITKESPPQSVPKLQKVNERWFPRREGELMSPRI
jgi:hypothetical protein